MCQDPSAEFHLNLGEVVRQVTALYRAADGPIPRIRTLDLQVYVIRMLLLFAARFATSFCRRYNLYGTGTYSHRFETGSGSGSGLDPDSIRSRRAKMPHKREKKLRNLMF